MKDDYLDNRNSNALNMDFAGWGNTENLKDTKDLVVTFDKKGVVSSYSYSSSDPQDVDLLRK